MSRRALFLWVCAVALAAGGVFFHQRQEAGALGGAISVPKQLWLCYTLFAWFALPIAFAVSRELPLALRRVYHAHLAWWGLRAVVEMWMLYVTVSWTPLYGITHDLLSIALLTWLHRSTTPGQDKWSQLARHWIDAIRLGLVPEMIFAAWFRQANEGRVGIYFADDTARFQAINRFTLLIVILAYAHLLWRVTRLSTAARRLEPIDARS